MQTLDSIDRLIASVDTALRTIAGASVASRPIPALTGAAGAAANGPDAPAVTDTLTDALTDALTDEERRLSGALMRVNHVGEVCAQALYSAQALATSDESLRRHFETAAREETDHLAWTQDRLRELGDRPSLLNPLWYAGAFAIGLAAGRFGDRVSLGFLVETERQVEQHLAGHLDRLPMADRASRRVVAQMMEDEVNHAVAAERAGAATLPWPARLAMKAAARVMTTVAHRI
jgi:ubiquinone biosynthesis monooxygenase Coq7